MRPVSKFYLVSSWNDLCTFHFFHSFNFRPRGKGIPNAPDISGGSLAALRCSNFLSAALLRFSNLSNSLCSCLILFISRTHWNSPTGWPRSTLINWGFLFRVASYRSVERCPWYLTPREPTKHKKEEVNQPRITAQWRRQKLQPQETWSKKILTQSDQYLIHNTCASTLSQRLHQPSGKFHYRSSDCNPHDHFSAP